MRLGFEPRLRLEAGIWVPEVGGWDVGKEDGGNIYPCVKAYIIGPFGAAGQKGEKRLS